jgi:hypothetical protein
MKAAGGDATFQRAGWIIAQSQTANLVGWIGSRVVASIRTSRSSAVVRQGLQTLRAMPADQRGPCAVWTIAAAVAGHAALAAILPPPARPTLTLTVLALLGAGLAGVAAVAHTRAP